MGATSPTPGSGVAALALEGTLTREWREPTIRIHSARPENW